MLPLRTRTPAKIDQYPVDFERFVVLANPKSSGRHQSRRKLLELTRLFPATPIEIFETSHGGAPAYAQLLHKHAAKLGPRTLLCIAAGDGSINFIIETLLLDPTLPARARRTPILPLWGGNGNDLACMLNGAVTRATMQKIFDRAQVVPVRAMDFRLLYADGSTRERIACVTASFGASAQVARRLNDHTYRRSQLHKVPGGRFLKEGITAWWAIAASETFSSEVNGSTKKMYEYTFCNGPRMAKWYRMPVRLTDDQFYLSTMEGKVAVITPTRLTLSLRRKLSSNMLFKTTQLIVHDPVWAQFDGEPQFIPADTEIRVQLSTRPFYAFSCLLADDMPGL
jgi:hypothetical protein